MDGYKVPKTRIGRALDLLGRVVGSEAFERFVLLTILVIGIALIRSLLRCGR